MSPTTAVLLFALCCAADAFVLRVAWDQHEIARGQFWRGYFERFGDASGIAFDSAVRPSMLPTFMPEKSGALAVPPGLVAVAALDDGITYTIMRAAPLAPYVVIGARTSLGSSDATAQEENGRLAAGRTIALRDDRLVLVPWDPALPWRADAARLAGLYERCAAPETALQLTVAAATDGIDVQLGRCSFHQPLVRDREAATLLAVLAGPEWISVQRQPPWATEDSVEWSVLAAVVGKTALLWWAFGSLSAVSVSMVLLLGSLFLPVPALLMWPVMALVGVTAAAVRAIVVLFRGLPRRWRLPVGAVLAGTVAWVIIDQTAPSAESVPVVRSAGADSMSCAVVGYSTVKGEGLRGEAGGLRSFLNADCSACRSSTAGMFAGGASLKWARAGFCGSDTGFGQNGNVIFLGGVNDDYFWGLISLPRLFVAAHLGSDTWRRNQAPAAAASRAHIDLQLSELAELIACARSRGAAFTFLHDFLVTDLADGRDPDRAAMLGKRREVVEAAGGRFVDLALATEQVAGVTWFNDYVHLSQIAQQQIADLVCSSLDAPIRGVSDAR